MESKVTFRCLNEDFVLPKDTVSCLKRYVREFSNKSIIEFQTKAKVLHVRMFFQFLEQGVVPNDLEDQKGVFQLLSEWDCHFTVIDSFLGRIINRSQNGYVSHMNVLYPVNLGSLYSHSSVFQEFINNNSHEVFQIQYSCSSNALISFLDLVQNRFNQIKLDEENDILGLLRFLKCNSLYHIYSTLTKNHIISSILNEQHNEFFDFSPFENLISENLEEYLLHPMFEQICFPFLCRVFQNHQSLIPRTLLYQFLQRYACFHGTGAAIQLTMVTNNINMDCLFHFIYGSGKSSLALSSLWTENVFDEPIMDAHNVSLEAIEENKNIKYCKQIDFLKKQVFSLKLQILKTRNPTGTIFDFIRRGNLFAIKYLLRNGIDLNQNNRVDFKGCISQDITTPIHYASIYGKVSILGFLVEYGANINSFDSLS